MRFLLQVLALIAAMLLAPGAQAQPTGSYQQTCRDIRVDGSTLIASCRDQRGRWRASALDEFQTCRDQVFNDNGVLRCSRAALPTGSYRNSCRRIRAEGGTLYALCDRIGGGTRETSLVDYGSCRSSIDNKDGYLDCVRSADVPDGSYLRTCRETRMSGTVLTATCRVDLGGYLTSSIDTARCTQPITNRSGRLVCGTPARPPTAPPPVAGFGAVELFNCQGNRRPLVIWRASQQSQSWSRVGAVNTHYEGNVCPTGSPGLRITLENGISLIRALDVSNCGADDPTLFNCIWGELTVNGQAGGSLLRHAFGP